MSTPVVREGRAAGAPPRQVRIELPEGWQRLPVDPGGDRRGQQEWLDGWLAERGVGPDEHPIAREDIVRTLTSTSRRAARSGVAFAAVLLELVRPLAELAAAVEAGPVGALVLSASVTVAFRTLPGITDPAVAALGIKESLEPESTTTGYPTQTLALVGLGGDRARPAVLRTDVVASEADPALRLSLAEVLWLVPGYSQLAVVTVTSLDRDLAAALTEAALMVAGSLRVDAA